MIRIVVTGSECTGKTTLSVALASHYGVPWIPEFARQLVETKGAAVEREDVELIARGQIEAEDRARAGTPPLLIKDTDLLSTIIYSRHYWNDCPVWIEQALLERVGDLYLLAGIDLPWAADGPQRDRGDRRAQMHALFRDALVHHRLPFLELSGPPAARLAAAIQAIDGLIESNRLG